MKGGLLSWCNWLERLEKGKMRLPVFLVVIFISVFIQIPTYGQNYWDGDDAYGNFDYCNNWSTDVCPIPSAWNSSTDLIFNIKRNPSQSTLYQNIGWKTIRSLIYASGFPYGVPLNGDGSSGFDFYYKIQNSSNYPQVINIPLSGWGSAIELVVDGEKLTINNPIYNNGNVPYKVYGSISKELHLNNQLLGNNSVTLTIYQYSKVSIGYNNGTGSFGGGVDIQQGELWFQPGAAINGGNITVGSAGQTAKVYLFSSSGGSNLTNNLTTTAGSNPTIGGLNSSGTNTYSGSVTLNQTATLECYDGGTVDFTGAMSGTGGITTTRISGTGQAIVKLSGTSKSYTGTTTVGSFSTLQLSVANAIPPTNTIIVQQDGILQISADQNLGNVQVLSGGMLVVDAGKTLTLSGTWSNGGILDNKGTIVITGPTSFPGGSSTIWGMNNLTINHPSSVTLDRSISVSGQLTMTSGILNATGDTLYITKTDPTGITGGSQTSFINGRVKWILPLNLAGGSTYVVPIGKGGFYYPLSVIDPNTGGGGSSFTAEAFNSPSNGTAGATLSSISNTEYWSVKAHGDLSKYKVTITRPTAVSPYNRIGHSTTQSGAYQSASGTPSGNSIINAGFVPGTGSKRYFVMAGAGPVTVAGANPSSNGDYGTLEAAFNAINLFDQTGNNISVQINGNTTEVSQAQLNQKSNPWSTLVVYPTVAGCTVAGSIQDLSLLLLNGADNVTIDGRVNQTGSTPDLTFSNTNQGLNGGTSTIHLANDATNNTLTYCNILGSSSTSFLANGGTIWIGVGAAAGGNHNNTISFCNIGPAGGALPNKAIYLQGTIGNENTAVSVTGCNIYDFFSATGASAGIECENGNTGCSFTNNKFFQTAARTHTAGNRHLGIAIANTSGNNFVISGNTIGYANAAGTGTYTLDGVAGTRFRPVYLNVGTTGATTVQNNTIAAIALTGSCTGSSDQAPFSAIDIEGGLVSTNNNLVGSLSSTGSITYTTNAAAPNSSHLVGIYNRGSSAWTSTGNSIGGITGSCSGSGYVEIFGLRGNGTGTPAWTCTGNTIGGTVASSVSNTSSTGGSQLFGIYNTSYTGSFSGNTVQNLASAGGTASTVPVTGIHLAGTAGQTVTGNTVHGLSNTNPTLGTAVDGIRMVSSGSSSLTGNFIYGLSNGTTSSTAAEVNGIVLETGTVSCINNIVSISSATAGAMVHGIKDVASASTLWHNTISLTNSTSAGTMDACYLSTSNGTRDIRSNIFSNARTGTGTRYAYNISNATGLSMSYNDNIGVTQGAAAGLNSLAFNPNFPAAGAGTLLTDYIPGVATLVGDAALLPAVTSDIDATARCNPTMGAQETASQAPPTPEPITGQTGYCIGQTGLVYSVAAVAGATSYTWSVPAGWTITAGANTSSITVNTSGSGPGIISVTATNSCGQTSPARTLGVNSGVIEVDGTTPPSTGCYPTLHEAFDAINLGVHMGVITVKVNGSTTETEPAQLNASGGTSSYSQVTMYPTAAGFQIFGSLDAPLITLSGAQHVTIDGRVNKAGALDLTLVNASSNVSATTLVFSNDASNNRVQFCYIKGSCATSTRGIITFGDAAVAGNGNNDNCIAYNDITSNGTDRPYYAIYSGESRGIMNARDTIRQNNIYNFLNDKDISSSAGIYLSSLSASTGTTNWVLTGNNFYDTSPGVAPASDAPLAMIYIDYGGSDYQISGNYIGGSGPSCSGTLVKTASSDNLFYGIYFDGVSSTISANTIRGFDWTNSGNQSWAGIFIQSGAVTIGGIDASAGNAIGSDVGTGSIKVTAGANNAEVSGIYRNTSADNVIIRYNTIGSIKTNNSNSAYATTLYGILNYDANTDIISNNTIGSSTQPNSLEAASPATGASSMQRLIGIFSDGGIVNISNNTVSNLVNRATSTDNNNTSRVNGITCSRANATLIGNSISWLSMAGGVLYAADASVIGISVPTAYNFGNSLTLTDNTISHLSNSHSTAASNVTGFYNGSKKTGTIERNFIHSISIASSSNNAKAIGIEIRGDFDSEALNYRNNIISLPSATTSGKVYGAYIYRGKTNFYHNTFSITGINSGVDATFFIEDPHATTAENNLFINASTGTGLHQAANIVLAEPGDLLDYNDYHGIVNNIGPNPNSLYNVDPLFPNAAGTALTDYIPAALNLIGNTALLATIPDDIDGTLRCVPTMGAQENRQVPTGVTATALPASPVCSGSTLNLTGTATGALSWSWSGPNGFVSTDQNPTIPNITTLGSGTYSLTVTNNCGTETATVNVTVTDPVPVSVSIAASANPVCAGTSVTFTATPVNGGATPAYQWYVNGAPVGANASTFSYTPVNGENVTCVMTSSDSCVTGNPATSNTVPMTVNPKPPPTTIYHN